MPKPIAGGKTEGGAYGRFLRDENGATALEYAMIASLFSVAVLGSAFMLGGGLGEVWTFVQTEVMAGLAR